MAISFDEFKQLRANGMDLDQIHRIDKIDDIRKNPDYQGGATSPANVKAQADLKIAQGKEEGIDTQVGINQAAYNATWPVSLMAKKALGDNGPNPQPTGSGNKLLADTGTLANPVIGEVIGLGGKAVGAVGQYMDKSGQIKKGLETLTKQFTTPEGLPKSELVRKIGEKGKDALTFLRQQKTALDKKFLNVSDKTATDIQESLPKYFRDNSTVYGNKLNDISEGLAKNGNEITRGEMSSIMKDTLNESKDELLAHGKPMNEIEYLNNKYSLEPVANESGLLDSSGKTLKNIPNPDEKLNFKEVVEDIKKVRGSLSARAKSGIKYSPEDVVAAKFMQKWGGYLETKVPELKELNKEYAPIIETMKTAGKYFKPYSQGVDKLQGVSFLRQMADDKMQTSGKKLMDILQNGTDNFPGIGTKTGELEKTLQSREAVKKSIDDTIKEYDTHKRNAQDLLAKEQDLINKKKEVMGMLRKTGITIAGAVGAEEVARRVFGH